MVKFHTKTSSWTLLKEEPPRIHVVFDCSAEFQGKSINKELLSGPVLTRFYKEKIAFMIGEEAMYHQVQVPEDQQSFLKSLWWESHDIDREPHDYVMCAHVFGATPSASCANYALHRTAVENEAVFEETAASALHHNFHVDDLLKSTEDLDSAKQLVKTTKELLLLVPELQRRMGVKDQDLFGDLPK